MEVKSFLSDSAFYEFHEAVGQFSNYRRILRLKHDEHQLILAIPQDAFDVIFNDEFGLLTIEEEQLKMLVFHPLKKQLVKWIK